MFEDITEIVAQMQSIRPVERLTGDAGGVQGLIHMSKQSYH